VWTPLPTYLSGRFLWAVWGNQMSPLKIVIPCIIALSLPACGNSASAVVQKIQDKSVAICSFLPSAQSVLELVKATTNVDVNVIAKAICDAVTAWAAKGEPIPATPELIEYNPISAAPKLILAVEEEKKEDCPRINGVCIAGTFVDKEGNPVDPPPVDKPKEGE
jgi:hypothetical protein